MNDWDNRSTEVAASREVLSGREDQQEAASDSPLSAFGSPLSPAGEVGHSNHEPAESEETIGTTSNHPFWSMDRQEFVQAGSLEIGERLQTLSGDVKVVQQKLPRPGPQPVFNLEVHNEHVYFVGNDGVLVHNAYDGTDAAARRAYLNEKFGRTGSLDADINARGGISPRNARAAEELGDTGENATELSRNLAREGRPTGPGQAAARLVPSTASQGHWAPGARSRELLRDYGIRINSGANGIPLSTPRPHNLTHRGVFLQNLEARLNGVAETMKTAGYGRKAIRAALQRELRAIGRSVPIQ